MRIDRLLVFLRFARTRSKARALIEDSHMRVNGAHVRRPCLETREGDVLTFAQSDQVRIVEILSLPARREAPKIARSHYRELDRSTESAIASTNPNEFKEDLAP